MRVRDLFLLLVALELLLSGGGCSGGGSAAPVASAPVLKSMTVSGTSSLIVGHTQQLSVLGAYSDGSTKDLTSSVAWSSSDPSVATVSTGGLVTGLKAGQTTISATNAGVAAKQLETIDANTLKLLSVSPQNLTMYAGTTQQFQAIGVYIDGTTADMSSTASWASSNSVAVSVSSQGLAKALTAGTASLTASVGSVSASAPLTVDAATSGFTYVSDLTDSRLLSYEVGDGSKVDFFGGRDSSGNPGSITSFKATAADGSWEQYALDSQGRPVQVGNSSGSVFGFTWTGTSNGIMTGISADRSAEASVSISVSNSGTILVPASRKLNLKNALSSPSGLPSGPTVETVRVTSCNGKYAEDSAVVAVTHVATFGGDPIPATWAGPGTGTFYADIGSEPITASSTTLTAAKNALSAVCNFLSNGQPTGNPALSLSPATCAAFSEFPPLAVGCTAAGYGLIGLNYACHAQSTWNGFNSAIDYVDTHQPLISVNITAALNGQSLQKSLVAVPQAGPVPGVAIDFPCVAVDHVSVAPATATIPVNGTATLVAIPFDSTNKVLQSSGFDWTWNSSPAAIASVVKESTPANEFSVALGAVTGLSAGTASITATETISSKAGSSIVTVQTVDKATREVEILPATDSTDVTINGVDLGIQKPYFGAIILNICSVPDGATASFMATMKQPVYPNLVTSLGFDVKGYSESAYSVSGTLVASTCAVPGTCTSDYSNAPSVKCINIPGLSQ